MIKRIFIKTVDQVGAILFSTSIIFMPLQLLLEHFSIPMLSTFSGNQLVFICFVTAGILGLLIPSKRTTSREITIKRNISDVWNFLVDPKHDEKLEPTATVTILNHTHGRAKWKISQKSVGKIVSFVKEIKSVEYKLWDVEAYQVTDAKNIVEAEEKFRTFGEVPAKMLHAHFVISHEFKENNNGTELSSTSTVYETRGPYFKLMAFALSIILNHNWLFLRKVKTYLEKKNNV